MQTNDGLPLIDSAVHERGFLLVKSSLVVEHIRAGHLVKLFEEWLVPKLLRSFSDLDKY
jgi:LysR family glycine cleavage system transcriptional activator